MVRRNRIPIGPMNALERRMGRYLRSPDGHDAPPAEPPPGETPPPAGGDTPPPAVERPDWLPEKFWDGEAKAPRVDALAKSYAELEKTRVDPAKLKEAWEAERIAGRPEAPDAYKLPEDERFDAEALAASPVVGLWRKAAHEAGLPQDAFEKVLTEYADAEIARMEQQTAAELAALGENGKARTEAVGLWARRVFGETPKLDAIAQVTTTAAGVEAVEHLMKLLNDAGVDPGEFEPDNRGQETLADIRKLMDSREYWDPSKRDPAVVKRVEDFFARQAKS